MLRFTLGSIPVEVRPTHLLVAGLISWSFMPGVQASQTNQAIVALVAGMGVVFISILVHELGHAVVARLFGYRPAIVVEWFGGHTTPNSPGPIPWLKDILLTVAGPAFGLGLGLLALGTFLGIGAGDLGRALGDPEASILHQALAFFALANFLWAILNLMPVLPLDGGRISNAIFTRLFGRHGVLFSQGLSLLICAGAIAFAASRGAMIMAVFFGLWGFQAFQLIAAYFRGQPVPGTEAPRAWDLAFAQAATLFNRDQLAQAHEVAQKALDAGAPPSAAGRLHHLLGWVAVKQGHGQRALEHFAQVQGHEVEPQALAAAWSLAGDDGRALSSWELAQRLTQDPTVLHEWAGALLRLGRRDDVAGLPGVNLLDAYRAAESVLLLRGEFAAAARLDEQGAIELKSPELAYNAACAYSRSGDAQKAQAMLDRAASLGYRDAAYARTDPDLALVRQSHWFEGWLAQLSKTAAR